jgi:VWFA-related protein
MKLKTTLLCILLCVALPAPGPAQQAPASPAPSPTPSPQPAASPTPGSEPLPVFPSEVELVTVDAVVTDKKGNPVTDLKPGDFVLKEDGVRQSVVSFEAIRLPDQPAAEPPPPPPVSSNIRKEEGAYTGRTFAIVFDDVHLTPFQAHRAKAAVAEFLKSGLREGDRVLLVASGGGAWWSTRMMEGRDELVALLKRLDGRLIPDRSPDYISDYEAMRIWVYTDPQVENRVERRFEQYGAVPDQGARGQGSGSSSGNPFQTDSDPMVRARASEVYYQAAARNRITLAVLERVIQALEGTKGRKSVVLVSEGFIYDPNLDEFKKVLQASRRSNAAIYFLDTRGLQGLPTNFTAEFGPALDTQDIGSAFIEGFEAAAGSENLASDSGGFIVKNTNDLAKGIQKIAAESQTYYLLGYHPTNTARDGRFRKIDLDVDRKGVDVRARKGYYAPLEGTTTTARAKEAVDPAFQRALDSPFELDAVPLRMTSYVFDETLLGKAKTLVAADVDVASFAFQKANFKDSERFEDSLEFLMVVAHRETGEYFRYDQTVQMKLLPATRDRLDKEWFPVVREFELAPGAYQAKIVVRDKNSGRIGTVMHEFEVPGLESLRTSTPIISDSLQETPGGRPRPMLLARRTFDSGGMLYCQYEVYGAAKDKATGMPKVTAGYEIRKSDGTIATRVDPSPIMPTSLGALSRMVGTSMKGVSPGDYEIVVDLKDEIAGKSLEVREPFTLKGTAGD